MISRAHIWLTCICFGVVYMLFIDIAAGAPFLAAAFVVLALDR